MRLRRPYPGRDRRRKPSRRGCRGGYGGTRSASREYDKDPAALVLSACVGDQKTAPAGNGGVPCHVGLCEPLDDMLSGGGDRAV